MEFACVAAVVVGGMVQAPAAEPTKGAESAQELLAQCRTAMEEGRFKDAAAAAERALDTTRSPVTSAAAQVFLTAARELQAGPPGAAVNLARKLETKVSFDFVETPFPDAVTFLQQITGATIIMDVKPAAELRGKDVTLRMNDAKLSDALKWIARQSGLSYKLVDDVILIGAAESLADERGTCAIAEAPFDVTAFTGNIAGRFTGYSFAQADRLLIVGCSNDGKHILKLDTRAIMHSEQTKPGGADADVGALLAASPPEWLFEFPAKLTQKISFDFVETPLQDVMMFTLQTFPDVTVILDQKSLAKLQNPEVTMKSTAIPMGTGIEWFVRLVGLRRVYADGAIVIISDDELANDPTLAYYDLKAATLGVRPITGSSATTFSGHVAVAPRSGTWFVRCKDLEGREMRITGVMK